MQEYLIKESLVSSCQQTEAYRKQTTGLHGSQDETRITNVLIDVYLLFVYQDVDYKDSKRKRERFTDI